VRVLIVERRSADTRIHSNGLAAEGIARDGARSGAEAVDGSLNGHCDLLLLDLVLAGLNGLEALEQLHTSAASCP
jgi:DNA-binding response OmpR family regulator